MAFVLLPVCCAAAWGQEVSVPALDPSRLRWLELSYRASKLGITATSEVEITLLPSSEVAPLLTEPAEGDGVEAPDETTLQMGLESRAMGRESVLRMFLAPHDAATLQRSALELAKKDRRNRYRLLRYTRQGIDSLVRRPAEGEGELPHEQWSDTSTWFVPFPEWMAEDTRPTEPSALLYMLAVADLSSRGDGVEFPVFARGHVMRVQVSVTGRESLRVDYEEISPAGRSQVNGRVEAIEIVLDGQPLDRETDEGDFEFLGLRGDVRVYLDPATRAPLRLSGNIKHAGKANVRLRRVTLR